VLSSLSISSLVIFSFRARNPTIAGSMSPERISHNKTFKRSEAHGRIDRNPFIDRTS